MLMPGLDTFFLEVSAHASLEVVTIVKRTWKFGIFKAFLKTKTEEWDQNEINFFDKFGMLMPV